MTGNWWGSIIDSGNKWESGVLTGNRIIDSGNWLVSTVDTGNQWESITDSDNRAALLIPATSETAVQILTTGQHCWYRQPVRQQCRFWQQGSTADTGNQTVLQILAKGQYCRHWQQVGQYYRFWQRATMPILATSGTVLQILATCGAVLLILATNKTALPILATGQSCWYWQPVRQYYGLNQLVLILTTARTGFRFW